MFIHGSGLISTFPVQGESDDDRLESCFPRSYKRYRGAKYDLCCMTLSSGETRTIDMPQLKPVPSQVSWCPQDTSIVLQKRKGTFPPIF